MLLAGLLLFRAFWRLVKILREQMQLEINRLADDNRRYREIYLANVQGLPPHVINSVTPPHDEMQPDDDGKSDEN